MTRQCIGCGAETDETVCVYGGRDYPPRPPDHAPVCTTCQEERARENAKSDPPDDVPFVGGRDN